ncbi:hypothetical protein B0J14DRAFT_559256 [Halenospora varia]|nr:hypothetical protein B0J14DRAFT_559256 [Halenospora varia]
MRTLRTPVVDTQSRAFQSMSNFGSPTSPSIIRSQKIYHREVRSPEPPSFTPYIGQPLFGQTPYSVPNFNPPPPSATAEEEDQEEDEDRLSPVRRRVKPALPLQFPGHIKSEKD